nr:MAG TPA_asm: hypothetical protein [Bacteriophage sp.]
MLSLPLLYRNHTILVRFQQYLQKMLRNCLFTKNMEIIRR